MLIVLRFRPPVTRGATCFVFLENACGRATAAIDAESRRRQRRGHGGIRIFRLGRERRQEKSVADVSRRFRSTAAAGFTYKVSSGRVRGVSDRRGKKNGARGKNRL